MTIAFIAGATASGSGGPGISITHGLTILAGDTLIAIVNCNTTITLTSDSSLFDKDDEQNYNGGSATDWIWSRIGTGSEASSYAWTQSQGQRWSITLMQFRGADAAIYDVAPAVGNYIDATDDFILPNITVVDGAMAIAAGGGDVAGNAFNSIDNSYINYTSPGLEADSFMATRLYATGVTTSNTTVDVPFSSTDTGSWHFSLLPAAGGNPWYHYAQQQIG